MTVRLLVFAALALSLACGCEGIGRRVISDPGKDEVLRVVSGDRIYFTLQENVSSGLAWDYVCHDPDVEVTIDHERDSSDDGHGTAGRAEVRIRIHRGYDGPSTVRFVLRRSGSRHIAKEFSIGLYKRTGDVAFWE